MIHDEFKDLLKRCLQVRVRALDAVVEDGDGDALAGDALEPSALHIHVQAVPAVQVPHLGKPAKGKRRIGFSFSVHIGADDFLHLSLEI